MPRACLPHPWVDFFALMASFVGGLFPTTATQHQGQVQSLGVLPYGSVLLFHLSVMRLEVILRFLWGRGPMVSVVLP